MAKRRVGIIAFLLCLFFCLMPCYVQAASTTDALEQIDLQKGCTLTFSYVYDKTPFSGVAVKLYKIADVSADFQYTSTPKFASLGVDLNGVTSNDEWDSICSTLEAFIVADGIKSDAQLKTDKAGEACFEFLKPGLYMAVVGRVKQGDVTCYFNSALINLPGLDADGYWQYEVVVAPKAEVLPSPDSDKEQQMKVVKLWKNDQGRKDRPKSVKVEILRNDDVYKTVTLSKDNNWSYSWSAKDDGAVWTVKERNVPSRYVATLKKSGTSFVLTNTFTFDKNDKPNDTPQTGDTSNIMLYVVLMIVSGGVLITLGVTGKRNGYDK